MGDGESRDAIVAPSRSWGGPKPESLAFSLLLHSGLAFVLLWFSGAAPAVEPSLYEQVIQPHEDHIVWFPLKEIPKISSGDTGEAKAETFNRDTIIHEDPDAAHDNRLVWRTPNRPEPEKKTPAPDMIAVERGADARIAPVPADSPPPATRPFPKTFVAPAAPPPAQAAKIRLAEPPPPDIPKLAIPDAGLAALTDSKVKFSRRFVPPPPVKKPGEGDAGTAGIALPEAPTLAGSGGTSDINALIVNSVHLGGIDAAPPRQSAISTGPNVGTGGGNGGKGGVQIPGVTLAPGAGGPESTEATLRMPKEPGRGAPAGAGSPPGAGIFVAPKIAPLEHTLSAPLPPSSRNIPKAIEARFAGRIVYTMLLPMKGVPGYAGDWTIWFAETAAGTSAPMRAPLPMRRPALLESQAAALTGEVRLTGRVTVAGKIDSVAVIGGAAAFAEAAIKDLESWQFLPALRNREPVDVDLIIDIPFGISPRPGTPPIVPVLTEVDRSRVPQHN